MLTHDYLSVPRKLVIELRDSPLAIGIYFLISRLFLVHQQPVLLSRGDLRHIDEALREGTVKRALERLVTDGWLLPHPGPKGCYLPAWGQTRAGAPYPWQIGPRLGCPTHIETVRVDRAILDLFVGRFQPHRRNPHFESYFTQPLLGLADVGAYVRAAVLPGLSTTAALRRWGLVDAAGAAQAIPDDTVVLAVASQHAARDGFQLTEAGWRKLGWFTGTPPAAAPSPPTPLLLVPPEQIGTLIPPPVGALIAAPITCSPADEGANTAAGRAKPLPTHPRASMQGTHGTHEESQELRQPPAGGGGAAPRGVQAETAAARLLTGIGVLPAIATELAAVPADQADAAIRAAAANPAISNKAGWVVAALRRQRDLGLPIPPARPRGVPGSPGLTTADIDRYTSGADGLFRRGSDVVDLGSGPPAVASGGGTPPARPAVPVGAPPGGSAPRPGPWTDAALGAELRQRLLGGTDRRYHAAVRALAVRQEAQRTLVVCASVAHRLLVQDGISGALRCALHDLGVAPRVQITDCGASGTG